MTTTVEQLKAREMIVAGSEVRVAVTPVPGEEPAAKDVSSWDVHARILARGASRAVLVCPGVTSARFQITGSSAEPELDVECVVREGRDALSVIERVTDTVIEDLEEMMGAEFVERRIVVRMDYVEQHPGSGLAMAC